MLRRHRHWLRRWSLVAATAALLLLPAFAFGGGPVTQITVGDDFFQPKHPASITIGGNVVWQGPAEGTDDSHNVRQDVKLFRSGSPSKTAFTTGYSIAPSAGTFHYYCELHGSKHGGMAGVVKVAPRLLKSIGPGLLVQWAYQTNNQTGSRFDVRYKVNNFKWKTWKNDTTKFEAKFGAGDHPVHLSPGHTYRFEARSEKKKVSRRSGWSPPLKVSP